MITKLLNGLVSPSLQKIMFKCGSIILVQKGSKQHSSCVAVSWKKSCVLKRKVFFGFYDVVKEYSRHKQRHCGCQTIIDKFRTQVRIIAFLANLLVLECAKSARIHNCVERLSLLLYTAA